MTRRLLSAAFSAIAILAVAGCGGGNNNGRVEGKVTFDGQPVTGGNVTFFTSSGAAYSANIRSDGSYSIADVPPGEMTVTVETESINPNKKPPPTYGGGSGSGPGAGMYGGKGGGGGGPGAPKGPDGKPYTMDKSPTPEGAAPQEGVYVKIPEKYASREKSGITKSVNSGKQTIDIELSK
jgi:hypothetical protein